MIILGIDYGLSKVGISISSGSLAEPLVVIKYKTEKELIEQIEKFVEKERVEKVVVGISEGQMAEKTRKFIESLSLNISLPIEEFDETLSTQDAQRMAIESGMKRSKRKNMEDAMAAAVMLQNYIDASS